MQMKICLNNPSKAYYAGTVVTGEIKLTLAKDKIVSWIIIGVKGKVLSEVVEISKCGGYTSRYKTEKEYSFPHFVSPNLLASETILPPGKYSFPFALVLPSDIPSTFRGCRGSLEYCLKASLIWIGASTLKPHLEKCYETISIVSWLDLNESPALKVPLHLPLKKEFSSIYGSAGILRAVVSLPATGFISGQAIPITVDIENESSVRVDQIRAILKRKEEIIFIKGDIYQDQRSSRNVAEISFDEAIEPKSSKKIKRLLVVPPLQPTCNIPNTMSWCYELKFIFEAKWHLNLVGRVGITLGTIPLSNQFVAETAIAIEETAPETFLSEDYPTKCSVCCADAGKIYLYFIIGSMIVFVVLLIWHPY